MRKNSGSIFVCYVLIALLAVLGVPTAATAQFSESPEFIRATDSAPLSRYYAPYALQAAAAYDDNANYQALQGPSRRPVFDGADVKRAITFVVGTDTESAPFKQAEAHLKSWQYQFGSEGYLTCFEADPECLAKLDRDRWTVALGSGPSFQVWSRSRRPKAPGTSCSEVSIVFRGTNGLIADWVSNLDPIAGFATDDYYRQLRRNIDPIIKKVTSLDCYRRSRTPPQIVSVGHSLGGGLAQFAGLANNWQRPRISKVFAFDPSPVVAPGYIDKRTLAENSRGLEVDVVFQSGEILQRARSVSERVIRPRPACSREVAFDIVYAGGSIGLHKMNDLANGLVKASTRYAYEKPAPLPRCPGTRYRAPATDDDQDELAPDTAPSTPVAGRSRATTVASAAPDWSASGEAQYPGAAVMPARFASLVNANASMADGPRPHAVVTPSRRASYKRVR